MISSCLNHLRIAGHSLKGGCALISQANLVNGGGLTFRAWGPLASAAYINGIFGGVPTTGQTDDLLLVNDADGYWTGFVDTAAEGDLYYFWFVGPGSSGYKRDPYARELATDSPFPNCSCIVRSAVVYPLARFRVPHY